MTSATPASPGRSWPARVPVAPIAVLAVVVVLALLGSHPFHIAWVPVVAIIVVRLLVGGRGRRRWDRRAPGNRAEMIFDVDVVVVGVAPRCRTRLRGNVRERTLGP